MGQLSPNPSCYCPAVKTCRWKLSGEEIEESLSVQDMVSDPKKQFSEANVVIIYAKGDIIRDCYKCRNAFEEKFRMPSIWFTEMERRSNGYFGYENILDKSRMKRTGTISWARFLMKRVNSTDSSHHKDDIKYQWVKLNAFVRWYASSEDFLECHTEIVLFDHHEFAQQVGDALISSIHSQTRISALNDPFWVYPIMAEEITALQDVCVWESRTLIRNYEKRRSFYRDPFEYLHEVSRHSLHINETLHVAESILDSMQKYHAEFTATKSSSSKEKDGFYAPSGIIQNRLGHLHTTLTHLRHRAESNHERVKAEISLSFNKSAQRESAATRTISLVGLLFLPAAFVASLFSTSFFNFDAPTGIWGLSDKFWIYWAVAIPVTALTILLWFFGPMIWNAVADKWRKFHEQVEKRVQAANRERQQKINEAMNEAVSPV